MNKPPAAMAVEDLYPQIAQALMRCLPRTWRRATLAFERLADDAVQKSAVYRDGDGNEHPVSLRPSTFLLTDLFIALGQRMEEAGHPRWQAATFTLKRNGRFDLNFVYPPDPNP